ncbi:hypothetical protein GGTG_07527 [Gaeumannomyces tritici R3-111a-1]|uniref:Uncharacterized protein n=1 Tax=Gaeumannomyces tritici (strain R3-111a-1) TaxID=644352 RepID=J3P1X9_GAET3|nr:hypothetical protein GGTG_07527 [Gaeumannomyces tritici R3-111a-1]EJT73671.1 hypothetical protein GGTG_07527 [Gaeumannomyces tritici R3-111a-1]
MYTVYDSSERQVWADTTLAKGGGLACRIDGAAPGTLTLDATVYAGKKSVLLTLQKAKMEVDDGRDGGYKARVEGRPRMDIRRKPGGQQHPRQP